MAEMRKFKEQGVPMVEIDGIRYREDDTAQVEAAKERAAAANKSRSASTTKAAKAE